MPSPPCGISDLRLQQFKLHLIGIKRDVVLDLADRNLWMFVRPYRIRPFMPRDLQTEIVGIALVRAITRVVGAGEVLLVDVFAGM